MNTHRSVAFRQGVTVVFLSALVTLALAACGTDMHDMQHVNTSPGEARASLTLQAMGVAVGAGSLIAANAGAPVGIAALAATELPLGGGLTLTRFQLGMGHVGLYPTGESRAMTRMDGPHMADLIAAPAGHAMGDMLVPGGMSYQAGLGLRPMLGLDPRDPGGAWAMVLELTYVEPGSVFTHTFVLRWAGPADLAMHGSQGILMDGGMHRLVVDFHMEDVFAAPYGGGSILDALLATPMDGAGVHTLAADAYPDLMAAILAGMHEGMVYGEDTNGDGTLDAGDRHMAGHSATGCGGTMM